MEHQPNCAKPMLHACVGVMCEVHERCARYAFIDGTRELSAYWLGTCARSGAARPGFIDVAFIGPPAQHQWRLTRLEFQPSDMP